MVSAQSTAANSAAKVHREMVRGLSGLATVAATAAFVGMIGTVWGIFDSFRGGSGERSAMMAAIADRLSQSLITTALGLTVAIMASWAYKNLSAQMADFDIEMRNAVRDLPDYLAGRSI